jgi:hypothetical protein
MRFGQSSQWSVDADQVILAHHLVERARAQQFSQGRRFAQALVDGVVKE